MAVCQTQGLVCEHNSPLVSVNLAWEPELCVCVCGGSLISVCVSGGRLLGGHKQCTCEDSQ